MDIHFTVIKKYICLSHKSIRTLHTSPDLLSFLTPNAANHFLSVTNHTHLIVLIARKVLKPAVKKMVLLCLGE